MPVAIELDTHHLPAVDQPESRREARGDAFPVASLPRLPEAVRRTASPRSRCARPAPVRRPSALSTSSSKRASASASRSASNSSMRVTRPSASEDPEPEELPLVGAAAGAVGAEVRPAHEERIGPQAEDVVLAHGDVVGDLEQRAAVLQQRFRPARGPGPQDPVVDDLDGGCERGGEAIEVDRSQHRRDRARRRRGAGARGAVGEEVGVALVQPDDGVAQPVGGEALDPPASSLRVDLDQSDSLSLVGADIELPAGEPAR